MKIGSRRPAGRDGRVAGLVAAIEEPGQALRAGSGLIDDLLHHRATQSGAPLRFGLTAIAADLGLRDLEGVNTPGSSHNAGHPLAAVALGNARLLADCAAAWCEVPKGRAGAERGA